MYNSTQSWFAEMHFRNRTIGILQFFILFSSLCAPLSLMRCFLSCNTLDFNSTKPSCIVLGDVNACDYFICQNSPLCGYYQPTFTSTQAAIDAASSNPENTLSRLFYVTAGTKDLVVVPGSLPLLAFYNIQPVSTSKARTGVLKFENASSLLNLEFSGMEVEFSDSAVYSSKPLSFNLTNSHLISNLTLRGANFAKTTVDTSILSGRLWVTLAPLSSVLVTYSQFPSHPSIFHSLSSRLHPYQLPEGTPQRPFQISLIRNDFKNSVTLFGSFVSGYVAQNTFDAVPGRFEFDNDDRTNRTVPHYSPNLILGATCRTNITIENNTFHSGTFYLDYPGHDFQCNNDNPYLNGTFIVHNRFPASKNIKFNSRFELKTPFPPAMSTTTSLEDEVKRTMSAELQYKTYLIDANFNYWGSPFGPWLCCNNIQGGSWVTTFVNPSQWCLDENCSRFSSTMISQACISYGCAQRFSMPALICLVIFGVASLIALISTIVLVIYRIETKFSTELIKNLAQTDLVRKVISICKYSLITSCLVDLGSIAISVIILFMNSKTPIAPGQHLIEYTSVLVTQTLSGLAIAHFLANGLFLAFCLLHKKHPSLLQSTTNFYYVWNICFVCWTSILSFVWVPYDVLETKKIQGGDDTDITNPSILTWVIYLPILINFFSALLVLFPTHHLSQMMYHFDYNTISSALEGALLKGLTKSKSIRIRLLILRAVMAITAAIGIAVVSLTIMSIANPERAYIPGIRFLTPKHQFRIRSGIALLFSASMLLSILLNFILTFSYTRVTLITAFTIAQLAATVSGSYDITFWIHLLLNSLTDNLWCKLNIAFSTTFSLLSLMVTVLLFFFRFHILKEIPRQAVTNLNQHLDLIWSSSPLGSSNQYIPILSQEDDGLLSENEQLPPDQPKIPSINH